MNKLAAVALTAATLAVAVLNAGAAQAHGGSGGGGGGGSTTPVPSSSSGTWPSAFPLPTNPGVVTAQTSTTAVVRSTETTATIEARLDDLYVTGLGCISKLTVNKPKDYFCTNPSTGKTQEVYFTYAALDPKPTDPSRSQTNAFLG